MKKGPAIFPAPSLARSNPLEREFQPQLNGAIASRAKHRVERSIVRRRTAATKLTTPRRVGKRRLTIGVGGAPRVCELGVIENVKHLDAELRLHSFPKFEALADR